MKKIISVMLIILLLISILLGTKAYAAEDLTTLINTMQPVASGTTGTKTQTVINMVIGILQVAGTGISLIVISLLGIKYILASPSEKADVKKNILPILIGCVLLFAAVNIVSVIEKFTTSSGLTT